MDAAYLLELAGGNRTLVREILNDFVASDDLDRAQLTAAVEARNTAEIQQAAHRIKGAARAIGANAYADRAAAVEHAAPTGVDIHGPVAALEQAARDLTAWVGAFE